MESAFGSEQHIPGDIQENLKLGDLKREIIKQLPWDSQAVNMLSALSPEEIFEIIPPTGDNDDNAYGLLFEDLSKLILGKENQESQESLQIQSVIRQLVQRGAFKKYSGVLSEPDFLHINPNFEIETIYEAKTSASSMRSAPKDQADRIRNLMKKVVELTQDPNPPLALKEYVDMINNITGGSLSLSPELKFIYVLPQNMQNSERDIVLAQKKTSARYIPLTKNDAQAIFKAALAAVKDRELNTSHPAKEVYSGFKSKRR